MTEKGLEQVRSATAADVMTRDVVYIDGGKTVADAIRLMKKTGVSSLVVNRRSHDDAWGIITRKDIVGQVIDRGLPPQEIKVFEFMNKPVFMLSPGLALKYCARILRQFGVRRAPVFNGTEIVGILSNTDILNAIEV